MKLGTPLAEMSSSPARSHGRPEQEKGAINTAEKAGRMLRQDAIMMGTTHHDGGAW